MSLVFDLHCDTPHNILKRRFNHIVPEDLHRQDYLGAVFAHFIMPGERFPFVEAIRLLGSTLAYLNEHPVLHKVTSSEELDRKKVNLILGVEGGHIFDNTFEQIESLYNLGVRVFTITWNNSNKLAHSALEADKKGLTRKGREFLKRLGQYDVIIDVSHASTKTVLDICENTENLIIASHSCVRALNPSFLRNIDDRAIAAIKQKAGVIGVNFSKHHLGDYGIADHINYLVEKFGIEIAAIGSDFDGINDAVIKEPAGLKNLKKELQEKGYKETDIDRIFSGNFLRVLKQTGK